MASASPLVLYMQAQPAGWQAVRESIQAGMTQQKDTVILLSMSHALVQICNSTQLRDALKNKSCSSHDVIAQLSAALDKRDPASGGQLFLIEGKDNSGFYMQAATIKIAAENGHATEVYTRKQWEEKQAK